MRKPNCGITELCRERGGGWERGHPARVEREARIMIETKATSEYSAVREVGAGFIDLSSRGRILVSGSEAVMFLNGLVTNDMKTLALNSWMPAAFANVQGRLLAVVRILHREDGFLIDTESVTREKVLGLLDRFTLAGDFGVTDLTSKTACVSVQGPRASETMKSALGEEAASVERGAVAQIKLGNRSEERR